MSRKSGKPSQWFYEAMPYLYVGSGVFVALTLPNLWGAFSGALLVSAGVLVWNMRRRHRHLARLRQDQRSRKAAEINASRQRDRHIQLVWKTDYECGNPVIDTQHRNLFAMGNVLLTAILNGETKLDVELQFDELIEKIAQHFLVEEALIAKAQSPDAAAHKAAHAELLERAKELAERYHLDQLDGDDLYNFIAREVLTQHILKSDRPLGAL